MKQNNDKKTRIECLGRFVGNRSMISDNHFMKKISTNAIVKLFR